MTSKQVGKRNTATESKVYVVALVSGYGDNNLFAIMNKPGRNRFYMMKHMHDKPKHHEIGIAQNLDPQLVKP